MTSLALVLSTGDLPLAELHAALLDGELYAVDECFSPVDTPLTRESRARALAIGLGRYRGYATRLVAEQHTAAWVWGATSAPPYPHQYCTSGSTHQRANSRRLGRVREVELTPHDVVMIAGLRLTSPLRTILDLARFTSRFGSQESATIRRLLDATGLTVSACVDDLRARHKVPLKRQGLERLSRLTESLF